MGLVLDHLAASTSGKAHHFLGNGKISAVIYANLGDDKRWVVGANLAVGDLHDSLLLGAWWCNGPSGLSTAMGNGRMDGRGQRRAKKRIALSFLDTLQLQFLLLFEVDQ
jgi:hypothetical protein